MKYLVSIILIITTMQSSTIFNFNKTSDVSNWSVINDVVMGGRSTSSFYLNKEGLGVFEGRVSLENNGGFSSLRYHFNEMSTETFSKIILKVRGDNKTYQFRVKEKSSDYYSYVALFKTTNDWQKIEISLSKMYPAFRGRKLDIPNFNANSIENITFLIGNKIAENFKLEIESIILK
jgi:hypothetical protein